MPSRLIALVVALAGTTIALAGTAHAALKVTWMPAFFSHLIPFLEHTA